jgi:hypothetical protein
MFRWWKRPKSSPLKLRSLRAGRRNRLLVEQLESRTLLTYGPSQIVHGYQVDQIINPDGNPGDGTGETIAISIAYDAPNILSDLQYFDNYWSLPNPPSFVKATPQGQPQYNSGWASEATLDVEWAHVMAPGANILLVEGLNNSFGSLFGTVDYARNYPGVSVVSMSWGSTEFFGETSYDSYYFTTPAGHNGVTFVAASGDHGAIPNPYDGYPAASPNVLAVGGTSVTIDASRNWVNEIGWSGSGGGISAYESQPAYQSGWYASANRTIPDIALNAASATPVWVRFNNGWYQVYGTSAAAPAWAGIIAIANQGLDYLGMGSLDGPSQTLPTLYALAAYNYTQYYHDITVGNNGYAAGPGYDLVTGIGTPYADQVVHGLVYGPGGGGGAGGGGSSSLPSGSTPGGLEQAPPAYRPPLHLVPAPAPPRDSFSAPQRGKGTHPGSPRPQGNMPITPVQPLLVLAATSVYGPSLFPTSGGGMNNTLPPTYVNRAAVVPLAVYPPSAPVLAPPPRVESGGGDNAVLPDDTGSYDPLSPDYKAGVAPPLLDLTAQHESVSAWRSSAALCAEGGETRAVDNTCQAVPGPFAAGGSESHLATALAVLFALGGYWGRLASEEMRVRRFSRFSQER